MQTINPVKPIAKAEFKSRAQNLRLRLLELQLQISRQHRPVIIIIGGDHRSARHQAVHTLLEWLDPRFIAVNAYPAEQPAKSDMPFFWPFWQDLPAAGHMAIFMRDWTSQTLVSYLNGELSDKTYLHRLEQIRQFERSLIAEGAVIIKIWLHLSQQAHQQQMAKTIDTPYFEPKDELAFKHYQRASQVIEQCLGQTQNALLDWQVIASEHPRQRDLVIGEMLSKQLEKLLNQPSLPPHNDEYQSAQSRRLASINLGQRLSKISYKQQLSLAQQQIHQLSQQLYQRGKSLVAVFEGVDAAGKGGAIRRLVSALDVGHYRINAIAKPSEIEAQHHYLWRFWRQLPKPGHLVIFDRSWYGRVLVERVEGFATTQQWQRAYEEINSFEAQLSEHGILLLKFWLHIDQDEQLKRFQARELTPHKQHKITAEDYRNRQQWPAYQLAIEDMLEFTDTACAPWHIISAQDKKYARIEVLKNIISSMNLQLEKPAKNLTTPKS